MNSPLLVFADDWGRHPSSCQHLVRCMLPQRQVYWVNTIGTRTPRMNLATFKRGAEKLRQWTHRPNVNVATPANLRVLNPKMWPWFSSSAHWRLNRELLLRQISVAIKAMPLPPVAVTTVPVIADLMGKLPVHRWVYYCVDDFAQWPGLDQRALRSMEQQVVREADVLIAASESLQTRLAEMGRTAHCLTHGVDVDFWTTSTDEPTPPEFRGLEPPLIVFWGVVDRRMDSRIIETLAKQMNRGTIVIVGPTSDPDPASYRSPRIVHVPAVPFERLPHLARAAAVLIMPYANLPVTRALQPLKLKEYLATGKPVVASAIPATVPWADCMDIAESPQAFCDAVQMRVQLGLPDHQRIARKRLAQESWPSKAKQFERLICSTETDARLAG